MRKIYFKQYALVCLLLVLSCAAFAQTGSITGRVLDNNSQTLPGVTVGLSNSTLGASTDVDGNYRINNVPAGTYTISARFFGFVTQQKTVTVTASAPAAVNFQLQAQTQALNEVVVIGYGTTTRKEATGAITTVSSKDFQKGTTTSPAELIQGKIAGVAVTTNSGQPGAGATIRIRQGASLNASNDPLIVVDGLPLSPNGISGVANPLSLINPDDIETFTVLKDAASTAIYGSRASNGVIFITTKKGASGKPQVNFSSKNSIATLRNKLDVLSADEIRSYVKAYDAAHGTSKSSLLGSANTDWQDQIYQNALTSDNNLSIAGSTKKLPYRVSVGYLDQQGLLKTDRLQRTTTAIRLSPKFFHDDLKLDFNLNGSYGHSRFANQGAIGAAAFFDPTQSVYSSTSPYNGYYEWYNTPGNASSGLNPNAPRNPVGVLNDYHSVGDTYRSFGNFTADYRFPFLKALRANVNLGYDLSKGGGSVFVPANAAQAYTTLGTSSEYHQKNYNSVAEAYLNYTNTFKSIKSKIDATAGYSFNDFRTSTRNFATYNAAGTLIAGTTPLYNFDIPRYTIESYYGRVIYTFDDKYILQGSIRTDGSSKFSPENRWGVFPAVAFTWRIIDENFLKDSKAISDLKLRLSYGLTGQQDGIPYYSYIPTYYLGVQSSQYQFGNNYYYMYTPSAYDANLKWENTKTTNVGFDFGFLNQRISGTIDAYYKNTSNLLSTVYLAAGTNFTNRLTTNVGNMVNRGIEFNLNAVAVKTKDINWSLNYNIAYNYNKVTNLSTTGNGTTTQNLVGSISGGTGNTVQVQQAGYTANAFYIYKQVYDSKTGKPLQGVYQDLNGDGVINSSDLYQYKTPYAKFIMGFSTQFTYKKWTASTVLRAHLGNYMYNNVQSNSATENTLISSTGIINNANSNLLSTGFTNSQYLSDYYVQNASFLRMDNAGLSYNFGNVYHKKVRLNVGANVQNVFVITKYKGLDPEVYGGIDNNFYPRPRTYTLSLNVGF
ncbi:SusC/RagA family TonB-linked outer membrane protein [Mucilaginibacter robiniae]|uniref:SusC/RagA family TonB-linked outer membrane protein n=1 Tax=Mucilaginibacter robiniae TaxID=2728022 RepID=A0A7L5E3Y5_9SPHI|nr:SusC/RagA family TonB-linked outer membrane protein [Mucilaginibacter robiniae]QJD95066.1 SusC/RagA family TonB-linked outer membrane protein [Mucilaginibacter robiniae]